MNRHLPYRPHFDHLREQAKDLLKHFRKGEEAAAQRISAHHPAFLRSGQQPGSLALSDAQLVIAREYGFDSWPKSKVHVEGESSSKRSDSVQRAIRDLQEGKYCILFDDESRENEGDLVLAAERVSPAGINFITKFARGTLCLAMTDAQSERLGL